MTKYVYPAIFTSEEGGFSVDFPDLESCYTSGEGLADALAMAEDVLAITLFEYERDSKEIPAPSDPKSVKLEENEFVTLVATDTLFYQRKFNSKAVKKTLTIPGWLNDLAVAANINFSKALQDALAERLNVQI